MERVGIIDGLSIKEVRFKRVVCSEQMIYPNESTPKFFMNSNFGLGVCSPIKMEMKIAQRR